MPASNKIPRLSSLIRNAPKTLSEVKPTEPETLPTLEYVEPEKKVVPQKRRKKNVVKTENAVSFRPEPNISLPKKTHIVFGFKEIKEADIDAEHPVNMVEVKEMIAQLSQPVAFNPNAIHYVMNREDPTLNERVERMRIRWRAKI